MVKYLVFADKVTARKRNREMTSANRDSSNANGDGKLYVTMELHAMRSADDGQAVLEIEDDSQLTPDERRVLVEVRPSKFDPPEQEEEGSFDGR